MSDLFIWIIAIAVIASQAFFGYIENKYLGAIYPVVFLGFVLLIIFTGNMDFSFRSIVLPISGTTALILLWLGGKTKKVKKRQQELEKMKAMDYKEGNNLKK